MSDISRKILMYTIFLVVGCGFSGGTIYAADNLMSALKNGQVAGDIRYRLETLQFTGKENAVASTARTRLSYITDDYKNIHAAIEFEGTFSAFTKEYNSGVNDKVRYAEILDPVATHANQRYIAYHGLPKTSIYYGRQRIVFDNGRFVGSDSWRQNEQSFDGLTISSTLLPEVEFTYAYIYQQIGVSLDVERMKSNLLNISYHGLKNHIITGYSYFLNLEEQPINSQRTSGARMTGEYSLRRGSSLLYSIEYAKQRSYKNSPAFIESDYVNAGLGVAIGEIKVQLGFEQLSGDDEWGFSTPLASKHSFNGRTSQFLATPLAGLRDVSISLAGRLIGLNLVATFHDFSTYVDNRYIGNEWNVMATRPINRYSGLMVGYANYSDADSTDDTGSKASRFWFQYQVGF